MSTPSTDPSSPAPPIVSVGPCGSTFLSVDPSVDEALDHLADHGVDIAGDEVSTGYADAPPAPDHVALFDRRGRELRIDVTEAGPTLRVCDPTDRRGELAARVDEIFAHVRELAYRATEPGLDPATLRPPVAPPMPHASSTAQPNDAAFDAYVDTLCRYLSYQLRSEPDMHAGSWWHNVFHRFG